MNAIQHNPTTNPLASLLRTMSLSPVPQVLRHRVRSATASHAQTGAHPEARPRVDTGYCVRAFRPKRVSRAPTTPPAPALRGRRQRSPTITAPESTARSAENTSELQSLMRHL